MTDFIPELVWVGLAEESPSGTDAVPLPSTDGILLEEFPPPEIAVTEIKNKAIRETAAAAGVTFGRKYYKGSIKGRFAGPAAPPAAGTLGTVTLDGDGAGTADIDVSSVWKDGIAHKIVIVNPGIASALLGTSSVVAGVETVTITLAHSGAAITSTVTQVIAKIVATGTLITAVDGGGVGANTAAAVAETPLAGGADGMLPHPEIMRILEGAGLALTEQDIGATATVNRLLLELASRAATKTYTLCRWQAARGSASAERIRILNCVFGAVKLAIGADDVVMWSMEYAGLYEPSTSVATPASSVFAHPEDSSGPGQACTITIDGRTDSISELEISWPHQIVPRVARNEGSYGIAGFDVLTIPQVITCNPLAKLTSEYDRQTKVNAETRVAVSITIPTREGGKMVYTAPTCQMSHAPVEVGDDVRLDLTIYPCDSPTGTGDDSSSFYFERV